MPSQPRCGGDYCKRCGTPLWVSDEQWPELVHPFASAIVAGHGLCGHAWAATAPRGPSVDVSERQMGLRRLGTESSPDSPLEGDGFEPSVPVAREPVNIAAINSGDRRGSQKNSAGYRWFESNEPTDAVRVPRSNSGPSRGLSRRRRALSRSPGRCSGPPFVGVGERRRLGIAEQPGDLLRRHPVIRQVTGGKVLPQPLQDFAEGRSLLRQVPGE
jgi:hypothetical protein